jgi:hypothetical protein
MREMKEAGVEYEQRMEELEKLEHPKPLRDFIYSTFNEFSENHPWVGSENIRPKSIAREMYETYQSFAEYVREYDLQRAEGVLLRYLSDVYRVLVQTVPDQFKNQEIDSIIEYFGSIVRHVDSSLVDEWERLKNPTTEKSLKTPSSEKIAAPAHILSDLAKAKIRIMNEIFRFLRTLAIGDFVSSIEILKDWQMGGQSCDANGAEWTILRLEQMAQAYGSSGHSGLRTDPGARRPWFTRWEISEDAWSIEQTMVDPDDHNDWELKLSLNVEGSIKNDRLVLQLVDIVPIG